MYTVQRGDTLRRIAAQFGVTVDALVRENRDLSDPNHIRIGQRLRIPNRQESGAGYGRDPREYGDSPYEEENPNEGGWNSSRDNRQDTDVPWLRLAYEEEQSGVAEYRGRDSNPRIVEYLHSTGIPESYANTDETAWCAAFVNWCLRETDYETLDSAFALDWRNYGERLSRPEFGCVVVFQNGKNRHTGFYIEGQSGNVLTLGGNQSDRVCVQIYRDPVVAYRRPVARAAQYAFRTRVANPLEQARTAVKNLWQSRDWRELRTSDLNGQFISRAKHADICRKLDRL